MVEIEMSGAFCWIRSHSCSALMWFERSKRVPMSSRRERCDAAAARSQEVEDGVQQVGSRSAKAHFPSIKARVESSASSVQLLFASSSY